MIVFRLTLPKSAPFLVPAEVLATPQLYRMARQLAGPEGADDIVQDTFLRTPEGRLQPLTTES